MGDNLIAAICPRCGAGLKFPEGMERAYCMYCGTQVLIGKAAEAAHMVECTVCDGMGRVDVCKACGGSGNCTWSSKITVARISIIPIGSTVECRDGRCSACNGSGSFLLGSCPACSGTGKCPNCHGSGKCPACRGLGFIPNPRGDTKCSACDGRGVRAVDVDNRPQVPYAVPSAAHEPTTASGSATCPVCREPIEAGCTKCPSCGCRVD